MTVSSKKEVEFLKYFTCCIHTVETKYGPGKRQRRQKITLSWHGLGCHILSYVIVFLCLVYCIQVPTCVMWSCILYIGMVCMFGWCSVSGVCSGSHFLNPNRCTHGECTCYGASLSIFTWYTMYGPMTWAVVLYLLSTQGGEKALWV